MWAGVSWGGCYNSVALISSMFPFYLQNCCCTLLQVLWLRTRKGLDGRLYVCTPCADRNSCDGEMLGLWGLLTESKRVQCSSGEQNCHIWDKPPPWKSVFNSHSQHTWKVHCESMSNRIDFWKRGQLSTHFIPPRPRCLLKRRKGIICRHRKYDDSSICRDMERYPRYIKWIEEAID